MSDMAGTRPVLVSVSAEPGERVDRTELDLIAGQLRTELLSLPIDRVELAASDESQPRGKGGVLAAGLLLVKAGPHVVASVVKLLRAWQGRHPDRTLQVEIGGQKLKLTSASEKEAETIIAAWINHLNAGPDEA
jgi:hypothetical protein